MTTKLICNRCGEYEQDCLCEPPVECEKCKKYASELSALQKENESTNMALKASCSCAEQFKQDCEQLRTRISELERIVKVKDEALKTCRLKNRGYAGLEIYHYFDSAKVNKALALQPEK